MRRRSLIIVAQVCVLLLIAGGIYHYWKKQPPQEIIDDAQEDLIEEHGDTFVPVHSGIIERKTVHRFISGYTKVAGARTLEVALSPVDAKFVRPGQRVIIQEKPAGAVARVTGNTTQVSLASGVTLSPGSIVRVQIAVDEHANVLTVPAKSVYTGADGRSGVAVLERGGRWASVVPVTVGWSESDVVEISGDGLDAGQAIVTEGTYALLPRTRLNLLKD